MRTSKMHAQKVCVCSEPMVRICVKTTSAPNQERKRGKLGFSVAVCEREGERSFCMRKRMELRKDAIHFQPLLEKGKTLGPRCYVIDK